ncbi:MAG: DUF1501 domain-containing protein [Opitutales bacterium]
MKASKNISRRKFLGQASCAGVGSSALFSTLFNLRMSSVAAAQSSSSEDYKALVCVFLGGGNDSFNMLVPSSGTAYSDYQAIRSDLALSSSTLLNLNVGNSDGRDFGLHPSMPEVQSLFNTGKAAMVCNVGTLVEPTSLTGINNGSARLPLGLYSHSDQITHWQTSVPDQRSTTGWAGRVADILESANQDDTVSMNISLSGNNVFQTGKQVSSFVAGYDAEGGEEPDGLFDSLNPDPYQEFLSSNVRSMIDQEYLNIFEQNYASSVKNSLDGRLAYKQALEGVPTLTTQFPSAGIGPAMRTVARTIAARQALGKRRQTFFVMFGGWDHHDEVLNTQQQMLAAVSRGISALQSAMEELGVEDKVTTFTASDFGRTLTSNGRGSDHAWGGNHIVSGGAVNGGLLYGNYPELYSGNNLDTGRGRLIPTTSVDEYFAELALWFGVDRSALPSLFPNLDRFYNLDASGYPLGFLKS